MSFKISGVVIMIGVPETRGAFINRNLAIDTGGEYPQKLMFQTHNNMCDVLDRIKIGQYITLHFSLQGREWNGKIITNLKCYKIDGYDAASTYQRTDAPAPAKPVEPVPDTGDDLPF